MTVENREGSDIYFLVDRSGSMAGEKWAKTAEALIAFVNAAAQRDRVWITFFESDYRDFAEKPLERDTLLRDPNFQSLAKLGTDGGTELLPSLSILLSLNQVQLEMSCFTTRSGLGKAFKRLCAANAQPLGYLDL